jgi:hypothetical protein
MGFEWLKLLWNWIREKRYQINFSFSPSYYVDIVPIFTLGLGLSMRFSL